MDTAGGGDCGFFVIAGTLRAGNSSVGVERTRRGEIVPDVAARVAATGTT
jgi:hypothetical protein